MFLNAVHYHFGCAFNRSIDFLLAATYMTCLVITSARSHQYGEPWRPPYLAGDEPEPPFPSPGAQSLSCSAKHHGQPWKSVRPSSLRRKKITIRFGPLSSWASISPSQAHCQIEDEPSYTVTHSYTSAVSPCSPWRSDSARRPRRQVASCVPQLAPLACVEP